ncbi:HHIP-like protein 1 [Amphiura filiformis]|uniref:HHIP-like protein 1 n=1 Tax=Amphiura filiformis TaxID=82378 RepID=UPI003B20FF24
MDPVVARIVLQLFTIILTVVQSTQTQETKGCICFEEFASGLRDPMLAIPANDETQRLFIAEQIGVVYVYLNDKTKIEQPFLDLQSQVLVDPDNYDERGFLGLAFHPQHSKNRKLYVYYTTSSKSYFKVRISEFTTLAENINKVDDNSERVILEVEEPEMNHNGGQILFGKDKYLYAFLGDGGGGGDQHGEIGNGQNLTTLLAKVLRIDVDRQGGFKQYAIPPDNPFVNEDELVKRHEIYAYGARNMWRCSVDRGDPETCKDRGRIFCADVGQDKFEEVDIIENGGNYGWRGKEGYECYDVNLCHNLENEVLPIDVYDHTVGNSITGGYVYRGRQSSSLLGKYIFGDYVNGRMFTLTENENKWTREDICFGSDDVCKDGLVNTYPIHILAFGEDEAGEVYMLSTDLARAGNPGGVVLRIVDPNGGSHRDVNSKASQSNSNKVEGQHDTDVILSFRAGALLTSFIAFIVAIVIILYKRAYKTKKKVTRCKQDGTEAKETTPLISS